MNEMIKYAVNNACNEEFDLFEKAFNENTEHHNFSNRHKRRMDAVFKHCDNPALARKKYEAKPFFSEFGVKQFAEAAAGLVLTGGLMFGGVKAVDMAESNSPTIQYPSVQEYVAGQGNIKGNVPVEEYTSISEDFAIGANKDGYAVFEDPEKALAKLLELYSDGIALIQTAYNLEPLSADNFGDYKVYGSQVTTGTEEEQQQAIFVGKFLDIYENSYVRQ